MPRAGLSADVVVTFALEALDASSANHLSLKTVAERAGVATPSLYKHVRGLSDLERLMTIRVLGEATERMGAAVMGLSGEDALAAFLTEYRAFATEYPNRLALIERARFDEPAVNTAATRLVNVAYAVVRGFDLADDDVVHAVRVIRAAVFGFVSLENDQGYQQPTNIDDSFRFLIRVMIAGLKQSTLPQMY